MYIFQCIHVCICNPSHGCFQPIVSISMWSVCVGGGNAQSCLDRAAIERILALGHDVVGHGKRVC